MKIGLLPMSAKPFHIGHMAMIKKASRENTKVYVFVSLTDRKRKGELTVTGSAMKQIWIDELLSIMPSNVEIVLGGTPVREVYEFLTDANERHSRSQYSVYSGADDLNRNFPEKSRQKYFGKIYNNGQVDFKETPRVYSGTKMRSNVSNNDKVNFVNNLPSELSVSSKEKIWALLRSEIKEAIWY